MVRRDRGRCRGSWPRPRSTRCWRRCARTGTGRWSRRWCWAGCAAARCSGCGWTICRSPSGGCSSPRARAGISGWSRSRAGSSPRSAAYLDTERPADADTDRVFVVLKGRSRGQPLSARGLDEILDRRPAPGRAGAGDLPPAAAHLPDPAAGGRDGAGGGPGPGRARLDRVHPDLPAPGRRLAGLAVPQGRRGDRRAGCFAGQPGHAPLHRAEAAGERAAAAADWEQLGARVPQSWPRCAATWTRSPACCGRAASAVPTRRCGRFAAFLVETAPEVTIDRRRSTRRHIEDYKPWLADPARTEQGPAHPRDPGAPARHAADVLRPHRRVGLGRRPGPGADVPRRPAPPGPPAAQGARRRRRRQTAARRPGRPAAAGPGHRRGAAAHRAAGRRVHRAARRRGRADRRRALAARPGRQAPRGPLPAAAPAPGHPDRRLPQPPTSRPTTRCCCPGRTAGRWTATPSPGSSTRPAPPPGCRTSTPTSCGTPWPPRPSTAA